MVCESDDDDDSVTVTVPSRTFISPTPEKEFSEPSPENPDLEEVSPGPQGQNSPTGTGSDSSDSGTVENRELEKQPIPPRRSGRTKDAPKDYRAIENTKQVNFGLPKHGFARLTRALPLAPSGEPRSYKEAVSCPEASHWEAAMQEQWDSLKRMNTWKMVTKPAHRMVLRGR